MPFNVYYYSLAITFAFYLIYCEGALNPFLMDPDVSIISKVLHDFVDVFLVDEKFQFHILKYKVTSDFLNDILSDFLLAMDGRFRYFINAYRNGLHYTMASGFLFIDKFEDFHLIEQELQVIREMNNLIYFVAFIPSLTYDMLKSWQFPHYYSEIPRLGGSVLQYTFFITNETDAVTLSTVEWFSPYGCDHPHLIKLNTFNKTTLKWNTKLQNYEKFLDYHNCELVMLIPIQDSDSTVFHTSAYMQELIYMKMIIIKSMVSHRSFSK